MEGKWVSVLLSDNLLLFAWNLSWLLMLSVVCLFLLICRKHYLRHKRYTATRHIDLLLAQMTDQELFAQTNHAFHSQLAGFYKTDYLDLLYAWVRYFQALVPEQRISYLQNSSRCGIYDRLPENLSESDPARICISLEVCGLAGLIQYVAEIERYSWLPIYAPFACHALVRLNFDEGMKSLFRAYGHRLINNAEMLIICSEYTPSHLSTWATESGHWPLPTVLQEYWIS